MYDQIQNNRLPLKLENLGIAGPIPKSNKGFVADCRQEVRINSKFSPWEPVLNRVRQDSILGDLLFILHVNDLSSVVKSPVLLYGGDLGIWRELTRDADAYALQMNLDVPVGWSERLVMPFKAEKLVYMHIVGTKVNSWSIVGESSSVDRSHNDLGVTASRDLKTTAHCLTVTAKWFRTL